MKVISTESSQILAARIAGMLKSEIVDVKFSRFPDGELYLRTSRPDPEMLVVGSVTSNDALVQLLLLIDACEGSSISLVIPYMAYARQDKQFNEGEPLSARAVARALSQNVEKVITVNIHEEDVLRHFLAPATNLTLAEDIGEYIRKLGITDPLILAPDEGAWKFARDIAAVGTWDFDHLEKTRFSGENVKIAPKSLAVNGRDVIIVDDIISTGGTLATATSMLYAQGARAIHALCVHGVMTGGAYTHLISAGIRDIVCSDTIERACSRYTAARRISDRIGNACN